MNGSQTLSAERRREIAGILLVCAAILVFLALITDQYQSSGRRPLYPDTSPIQAVQLPGKWVAGPLDMFAGAGAHAIYCILVVWGVMLLRHEPMDRLLSRFFGLCLLTVSVAALAHADFGGKMPGGLVGAFFGDPLVRWFGPIAANVIAVTFAVIGVLLSTEFLFVDLFRRVGLAAAYVGAAAIGATRWATARYRAMSVRRRSAKQASDGQGRARADDGSAEAEEAPAAVRPQPATTLEAPAPPAEGLEGEAPRDNPFGPVPELEEPLDEGPVDDEAPETAEDEDLANPAAADADADAGVYDSVKVNTAPAAKELPAQPRRKAAYADELPPDYEYPKEYAKPSLEIFNPPKPLTHGNLDEQLRATSAHLQETLQTFNVEARVVEVTRGPTITRYELEPAPGVKVSRFQALADDLALALKAHRVRVEAPIPGKGRVGVEAPNKERDPVVIRDLLESDAFQKHECQLPLVLGKDVVGDVAVADLATMPHLLVAGATGAGKTVCVKSLLASLLSTKTPEELQLVLVDPKMVELQIFDDIPHLITPVVTAPKKAASALQWLITEMQERYTLFSHLRVRNIEVYNESVENGEIEMPAGENGEGGSVSVVRKLPYIVCVIDELADLMIQARAEVEDAIARLAQLARAVGIHLIIATQRPSVDVLTGVIKNNFPARISFQVSSRVDSRCILDAIGAERLIGRGDMLYVPPGQSKPVRIQGGFVSDAEMNELIAYLKTQAPAQYRDEIAKFSKPGEGPGEVDDQDDELFEDAVRIVLETGQASISMVQRRLRVGYTRAARLIDMMEMKGIVGPHVGSKPREILVDASSTNETG